MNSAARRPRWLRHGIAPLAVAAALLLRWVLWPLLGPDLPLLFYWPAVVFSAWYGGSGAGLLATLLSSTAVAYSLIDPGSAPGASRPAVLFGLGVFAAVGCAVSALMERLHRAQERSEALALEAASGREQLRGLAAIVESSEDAIVGETLDGVITTWNRSAQRLFGYAAGEVVGKHVSLLAPPEQAAEVSAMFGRLGRGEPIENYETVRVRKDGTRVQVSLSISPVKDGAGRVVGAAKIARDITRSKRAEEELRRTDEALRQADRRKDEMLGVVAHELRNQLAPIPNCLHIIRQRAGADQGLDNAREMIDRQVWQLACLVDDLLDVTRLRLGKVKLQKFPVRLEAVVGQAVETARPLVEARGHDLAVAMPPASLTVEGDQARLVQVLSNLLTNSAKYTPEGGSIWLSARQEGALAVIRVRDNGVGIPADMLPHVFEMYAQAAGSQGGLGVGLALARSLVLMHGGSLEAESGGPGTGSTFTVRLPVAAAQEGPAAPPRPAARGEEHSSGKPVFRVLVVDDNRPAADSLTQLLRSWGHRVLVAYEGPLAARAAEGFRPDVALLDLRLPGGMSGYDLARALRRLPGGGDALLVALTGLGEEEDRQRATEAGFDELLVKPVSTAALEDLMGRAAARPRPA
jgi:PAS domain S-box-containing protein